MRDERGVVAPLVALLLVVLLGFTALAVDVGVLFGNRRQMQNAVDFAALAGADRLLQAPLSFDDPATQAAIISEATSLANANGITAADAVTVTFSYLDPVNELNPMITVTAARDVPLVFATALGRSSQTVSVEGTSIIGTLKQPGNLWPWAAVKDEDGSLPYDSPEEVKVGARESTKGNFMALDFDEMAPTCTGSGGGKGYKEYILNGFDAAPPPPWSVCTLTGAKVGPTDSAIKDLVSQECTYGNDIRCPTIGLVPVLNATSMSDLTGKSEVEVVAFAPFQLLPSEYCGGKKGISCGMFLSQPLKGVGQVQLGSALTGIVGTRLWHQ